MAERKAVNKYYPPDWNPSKGSINKHVGQHPLRDRAKKIKQGILVIRFEMPYNIWCGGCNAHIGMGVRYNAEKSRNGNYYSTPIYKFKMKCHLCDNYFEIQTDPQNHDYVILSGARRKEQRWDPKENGQIQTEDKATQKKMATDAMYKLEHGSDDHDKGKKAVMNLYQLEHSMDQFKDDYLLNKLARNKFRNEKVTIQDKKASDEVLLNKSSLDIELVEEHEDDKRIAGLMKYSVVESFDEKLKEKRRTICNEPIFNSKTSFRSKLLSLKSQFNPFSNDNKLRQKTVSSPSIGFGIKCKTQTTSNSTIATPKHDNLQPTESQSVESSCGQDTQQKHYHATHVETSTHHQSELSQLSSQSCDLKSRSSPTGLNLLITSYSNCDT